MGGQRQAPAALPPGKTRYPLYRRLGGPPGPVRTGAENLAPPTGIRSPDRPVRSESHFIYRGAAVTLRFVGYYQLLHYVHRDNRLV